jgi:peptide/nickel transport system substrate-binding protein
MAASHLSVRLTRRTALRRLIGGAGVALLAACGPIAPASPPAVAPTAASPAGALTPGAAAQPASAAVAAATTAATEQAVIKRSGSLRIGIPTDITGLDGHLIAAPATNTLWQVFDRLTVYNARLEPQPMLAASWELSSDGTQLKLNLRKGVQFHSGRELTSADVAWNLERVKDPKVGAGILAGYRRPLTGVETPDNSTVILKSERPWPGAFDFFQLFNIVDKDTMEGPNAGRSAGGTGPFMLAEWVQGDRLTFKRNPNYWQTGKPYLDELQVSVSADPQANLLRFEAAAVDVVDSPPLVDTVRLLKDSTYSVVISQNPSVFQSFFFNTKYAPFDRKEVRQALAYAIDRKRMADTVFQGLTKPEALPWAANSPAYDAAKNEAYAFDPARTKSLLAAAGVSNLEFEILYSVSRPESASMAKIFQGDLAQIGVNATLKSAELASYFAQVQAVSYNGMSLGAGVSSQLQPQTLLLGVYHSPVVNLSGYQNEAWAKLVDDVSAELDPAKRKTLYTRINDFLLDEAWDLPVTHAPNRVATRKNVHGLAFELHEALNYADVSLA